MLVKPHPPPAHPPTHSHTCTHTYRLIHTHIYTHSHILAHIQTYPYTHRYTHTYTHTHTHTFSPPTPCHLRPKRLTEGLCGISGRAEEGGKGMVVGWGPRGMFQAGAGTAVAKEAGG